MNKILVLSIFWILVSEQVFSYQIAEVNTSDYLHLGSEEQNPTTALTLLNKAYLYVYEMQDSVEAHLYFQLGTTHGKLYHLDSSIYFFKQALALAEPNAWRQMEIGILNGLGNVARIENNNQLAIGYFHQALEKSSIGEDIDDLEWKTKLLGNLAGVYFDLTDFKTSLKLCQEALALADQTNNDQSMAYGYSQLGYLYSELDSLDLALESSQTALEYFQKTNDSLGLVYQYYSLASAYYQIHDLDNAKTHFLIANQLADQFGEAETFVGSLNKLGFIALDQQEYQTAINYAKKIMRYQQINQLATHRKNTYDLLYKIAFAQKKYQKALKYRNQYIELSDSIRNINNHTNINKLTAQFESKNNKREIISLKDKNIITNTNLLNAEMVRNITIVLAIVMIATLLLFFFKQQKAFKLKEVQSNTDLEVLRLKVSTLVMSPEDLIDSFDSMNSNLVNPLTQSEFKVLQLTCSEQSNKQIAEQLFVSVNTIKTHLKNVYNKLGVTSRKAALEKVLHSEK
ncbi:MAG: tetratricopeptide repeat protein [Reichenbachiella sp.]